MSYNISLTDLVTGDVLTIDEPHYMRGGTYKLGGDTELTLNITYGYADWYYRDDTFGTEKGIRALYGKTGLESIPLLEKAINALANLDEDLSEEEIEEYRRQGAGGYWTPTKKNAIKPLYQLLAMAKMRPDGVWEGD